jgi:hypothetical protein
MIFLLCFLQYWFIRFSVSVYFQLCSVLVSENMMFMDWNYAVSFPAYEMIMLDSCGWVLCWSHRRVPMTWCLWCICQIGLYPINFSCHLVAFRPLYATIKTLSWSSCERPLRVPVILLCFLALLSLGASNAYGSSELLSNFAILTL